MQHRSAKIQVSAAALLNVQGLILLQRRRYNSEHGGLWEFPGGKVETGESFKSALVREIHEELGVVLDTGDLLEIGAARSGNCEHGDQRIVEIRLFLARNWSGDIRCLDAEELGWFEPQSVHALAMPPLDYPLAGQLQAFLAQEAK